MSVEQSLMITVVCVAVNTLLGSSLSTLSSGGQQRQWNQSYDMPAVGSTWIVMRGSVHRCAANGPHGGLE